MRIPANHTDEESGIVWRREMIAGSYIPNFLHCETKDGPVEALVFLVNRNVPRYVDLPLADQARQMAGASGAAGTNADYLKNLLRNLSAVGIHDPNMEELLRLVRRNS
jgi:cation transport protein ChaC